MPPIWEMFERCFKFLELMAAPLLDPQAASITILWASIMMGMAMVRAADQWAAGFEDWCWELGMMWELALVHNRVDKRNRLYRINGRVGKFKIRRPYDDGPEQLMRSKDTWKKGRRNNRWW